MWTSSGPLLVDLSGTPAYSSAWSLPEPAWVTISPPTYIPTFVPNVNHHA